MSILEELRYHNPGMGSVITRATTQAAAEELSALRAENERLRELLERVCNDASAHYHLDHGQGRRVGECRWKSLKEARAALGDGG